MRESGVPIEIVDVPANGASPISDRKLVLARTDQHVAWRGDAVPDRLQYLVDILRGRAHVMATAQ